MNHLKMAQKNLKKLLYKCAVCIHNGLDLENYNLRADEFHTALILSVMRKVSISVDENRVGVAEYGQRYFDVDKERKDD